MKNQSPVRPYLAVLLVLAMFAAPVAAQEDRANEALAAMRAAARSELLIKRSARSGLATFVSAPQGRSIPLTDRTALTPSARALSFVAAYGDAFGLRGNQNVRVERTERDALGVDHVRMKQVVAGVPVTGGELIVHLRGSSVVAANGKTLEGLDGFDVIPALAANQAENIARTFITRRFNAPNALLSAPRLEIFNHGVLSGRNFPTRLAWFVEASGELLRQFIWIDARSGTVLLNFSQLTDAKNRVIHDANSTSAIPGTLIRSEGEAATGAALLEDALNAYAYSGDTYDYFSTHHGRDSFDGAGAVIRSTVRYCEPGDPCPYDNAFWTGSQMVYGAGYTADDDVVAHELAHAVTEKTANLFYYMQSGALNESFSDIFGESVDQLNLDPEPAGSRWRIGEELPGGAIRNMMTPTLFSDPGKMTDSQFKCDVDPIAQDGGGVHTNSGVPNHAFALMVDGGTYNGITIAALDANAATSLSKAGKIQYRALTQYLVSASDFLDNYNALQQACSDLIGISGITAGNCAEVKKALDAVQMSNTWPCAPPQAAAPALCSAGQVPVNTFLDNFEAGLSNWLISGNSGTWFRAGDPANPLGGAAFATSGVDSLWGYNQAYEVQPTLSTIGLAANLSVPANARLYFNHSYGFEDSGGTFYDGGIVEYSLNSGATWTSLSPLHMGGAAYGGTIFNGDGNPLGGLSGFVGDSFGYTASQYNLSSLAGQSQVRFRFRIGADAIIDDYGWFIDDFRVYQCNAIPTLSIDDVTVTEGDAGSQAATFTVTLSAPSSQVVTVTAATADTTATSGADYTVTGPGTLTFNPGVTTQVVTVPVLGDLLDEPDETYVVNLSSPNNATLADGQGLGTILDNDPLPTLSVSSVSVTEGHAGSVPATFVVSLSAASGRAVTVSAATANNTATGGIDYTPVGPSLLTFAPGITTQNFVVPVLGDPYLENNETFSVVLSGPTNATLLTAVGTGTIQDDDSGKTVCPSGCDFTRIQDAVNAAPPGGSVLVRSTYDSIASGEVFPVHTQVINQAGSMTISGETDGAGNPTTTVKTKAASAVDAFNIVSPGSKLINLRIVPGDATKVNRVVTASKSPGTCPGATCHLNGLSLLNLVIDFTVISGTTTPHFNTGNGIDVQADNVLIDKVSFKGIADASILIDGDNSIIRNSTLDGRDGSAVQGALAIGLSADDKLAGVACSGFPMNSLVSSNTLVGFANGIQWCSGKNTTISNNTITDISGRGIDSSGSQGTQIFGNVLQNNLPATYGISFSSNGFQTCSGNLVRNNKVLGRSARDMQRGIFVQNCVDTTIFQNEVRDFADNGGAIYVTMAPGVPTKTTIQGNTVIGGNAAGIVYFGADGGATAVDQSIIRDNVVNEFKRNGIVVQGIKGPRSGAGAGNVVAYNTVRAANQGSFGDTHAFNLQNLAETAFDRNTALDTIGGFGFFLANSSGVNGNCNTGAANSGGLFGQIAVTPVYGNANVNCRVALYSRYDFDGDGRSDVTMYRHTTGEWFTKSSTNGADSVLAFGSSGSDDIPAPGNYTTGAKTDHAIYRYTTGQWFIRRATDGGTSVIPFGSPLVGDVPMPADYDGDGLTDIAVFRTSTANAEWYIRRSSDGATQYVAWGCAACADLGVPGDYDGDGKADVAVYRRSTGEWFIRKSSDTTLQQVPFGDVAQGDIPVPGRYTQTSKTDMAVYRSLTGEWFIRRSTDFGTTAVAFGTPSAGDFPVAANFTQSGITDIAIYRPTPPTAAFLIRRSTDFSQLVIPYGNPGLQDAPLTAR